MPPQLTLSVAVEALAGALLVGLLIGVQREEAGGEHHPGLRDFLLVSLAGGICGVLDFPWLDAAGLIAVAAIFAMNHYVNVWITRGEFERSAILNPPAASEPPSSSSASREPDPRVQRPGVTTDLAAIVVFVLALLAASWRVPFGMPVAIGMAILMAVFLEARERLHKLARETITEAEFNATLAFVALVLVIYPLLPQGAFGPFSFFSPRQVWLFVILVSSISYVGYFLEKFLGEERGLLYTSVLGGLASTTAATLHFAKRQKQQPEETLALWRAFAIANSVQFPRALFIVALVNTKLTEILAAPLIAMMLGAVILSVAIGRWQHRQTQPEPTQVGNPFRLLPALEFGAMFTAVVFVTKASAAQLGSGAFLGTSLLGGLIDVATVIAPASDLIRSGELAVDAGAIAVLLALASNAVLKIVVAAISGTIRFAMLITAAFAMWAVIGAAVWWAVKIWLKI